MLGQPVLELGIGDSDGDGAGVLGDEGGWPEPGVEAVPVHLCFDSGEDFVPEVHLSLRDTPALCGIARLSTAFSTGVENFWEQTKHSRDKGLPDVGPAHSPSKSGDCSTLGRFIDTLTGGPLTLAVHFTSRDARGRT